MLTHKVIIPAFACVCLCVFYQMCCLSSPVCLKMGVVPICIHTCIPVCIHILTQTRTHMQNKHAHTLPYNHACICSHTLFVILKSYFHRQRRKRKWGKSRLQGGGAGVTSNQDGASTASKEEGAFPYSGEEERRGESSDFEDSRCRAVRKSKRPLNTFKNTPGQFVDA